jgi:hypothetical protein
VVESNQNNIFVGAMSVVAFLYNKPAESVKARWNEYLQTEKLAT